MIYQSPIRIKIIYQDSIIPDYFTVHFIDKK